MAARKFASHLGMMTSLEDSRSKDMKHIASVLREFACLFDTMREEIPGNEETLKVAYDAYSLMQEYEDRLRSCYIPHPQYSKDAHELILTNLMIVHAAIENHNHFLNMPAFEREARRLVVKQETYLQFFPWDVYQQLSGAFKETVARRNKGAAGYVLRYEDIMDAARHGPSLEG